MYKVLLVDDEINILEGIASLVDWNGCGTSLIYKAHNGLMAFEYIQGNPPDIVVTDIKMPGLNGLELIEKVHAIYPEIKFIVLSGHDEFEYAKAAMQFNVKYYLLKPSNEEKIEEALKKVVSELNDQKGKEQLVINIKNKLQNVLPKAKEQFLKEFITNKKYGIPEWEYFSQLFEMEVSSQDFKILVLEIDLEHDFESIFALKEIAVHELGDNSLIHLCTTIGERVVILCKNCPDQELIEKVKNIKEIFLNLYNLHFTTALSNTGTITQLHRLYNEALDCLTQRFYLGNGGIISAHDIHKEESDFGHTGWFDHEEFIYSIRSGNLEKITSYLEQFFQYLKREKYKVNMVKSHCLEIFTAIIRQAKKEKMDELFQKIIYFQELHTLEQFKDFIGQISREVAQQNYSQAIETQSDVIRKVLEYVEKHYADQSLSLSKIANDIFYMNSDYLGKLFKKETGEKFSSYLVNKRVQKAIELMDQREQVKMFEVAEEVGFGNNPRYFSQVFKKNTGLTPSEYKGH